jgi:hypothetical protein
VVLPTGNLDLLSSLVRRLSQFKGGTEAQAGGDGFDWRFCHYDVPKSHDQEAAVRAAINEWADEVGVDDVRVTIRLPTPIEPQAVTAAVVTWKVEDGPEDAPDEGSPDDVGPAWLTLYAGDEELSVEQLDDGDWMTRAEAQRLAIENGYTFAADD